MEYGQKYNKLLCLLRRKYSSADGYVLKDALSEAFKKVVILKNIKDIDCLEGHEQYLLTIAQNILIDNYRKCLNYEAVEKYFRKKETDNFYTENCLEMLHICCEYLDLKYLEVIVWKDIHGFSYKEISTKLNINIDTLKTRRKRAIKELKELIKNNFKKDVTFLNLKGI